MVASRSMPAKRWNASAAIAARSGSANGSVVRPRNENRPVLLVACAASVITAIVIVHDRRHRLTGAVPFQHGELGQMKIAALAIAEHPGEFVRSGARQRPAASCRRTPARCADTGSGARPRAASAGPRRMQVGFIARRDLQNAGFDLRRTPGPRTRPANRVLLPPGPAKTAGDRHGAPGPTMARANQPGSSAFHPD